MLQYILMVLMAAGILVADQVTKYLTVLFIDPLEHIPFIKGLVHFTYVENEGAAFSSFEGMQWLFALVFLVFTVAIIWEFVKKKMGFTTLERWCIVAIWSGGLGNMIDRLRMGHVVDMISADILKVPVFSFANGFSVALADFPVFNVADIFITCGCIFLLFHLIFFNRGFWKDHKK